jgi:hypothetical protein
MQVLKGITTLYTVFRVEIATLHLTNHDFGILIGNAHANDKVKGWRLVRGCD